MMCVTKVVCGISDGDSPIGGISTVPLSLPLALKLWGVTDVQQQRSIRHSLRQSCERLMLELLRQEAQLTAEQRGGHGSQTDLLGTFFSAFLFSWTPCISFSAGKLRV